MATQAVQGTKLRRVTIREVHEMVRLYEDHPIESVAVMMGRGVGTVHRYLREYTKVRPRGRWLSHSEFERTVDMYESGMRIKEIAEELGCSGNCISHRLNMAGVSRPRRREKWVVEESVAERRQRRVPSMPLVVAIEKLIETRRQDGATHPREDVCELIGISPRLLLAWRTGERCTAPPQYAEQVFNVTDRPWWEVYNIAPDAFAGRRMGMGSQGWDVVAWCEGMLRVTEAWGDV